MKDRIAQAIYVLGCLGAVFFVGWFVFGMTMNAMDDRSTSAGIWLANIGGLLAFSLGSYGAGWGIRWIITGRK